MGASITKQPVCTKNPPVLMQIPMPNGMQLVGMQPPIPPSQICGEYVPRADLRRTHVDFG
jgi:hypothetical protein